MPPCPKLTPAFQHDDSDSSAGCASFKEFAEQHEKRMKALKEAFEKECERELKKRANLIQSLNREVRCSFKMLFVSFSIEQNEVLIFQRQTLKEELSYARHAFQSADNNPEWNSPKTPVQHNGFDLMILHAGSDVAVFSRLLGSKLFSSSDESNRIVSPQKNSEKTRSAVSAELAEKFKSKF